MDYLIPKELPYDFLKSINIVSVERVKLDVVNGSEKFKCYDNVQKYLQSNEGEIQLGWAFSQLGNIVLKLTAHAVVKLRNGSLKCVTPSEHGVVEIHLLPDDSVASLIVNDRLPAQIYPLVSNKVVEKFVKLENLQSKMRLEGNKPAVDYIMNEKYLLSTHLIKAFNTYQ
ncbi:hypothetical protein AKG98_3845 [Moritella sp. JT01]|uniref:hypothetical protein n=1 Tax=Moritella sp. JT01 TaxID=756698 RepID=UPI000796B007|nr:hypothetical protein [Moritella sp. JT01]KXO12650.1 hypothetical protein AKG98_3845 [Moritella sp. JT01]